VGKTVLGYPYVRGKRADGTIVQGIVPQFDGSTYGAGNCGACGEAHRIIAQQHGKRPSKGIPWYPTGASIRRETGDTSGGLMPSQTRAASTREYGIVSVGARIGSIADVARLLWDGYTVDLLMRYGPIADDGMSGSPGFRGNHRYCLSGIRTLDSGKLQLQCADSLYDGRRSGIPRGPQWIDADVIWRAAGALEMTPGNTVTELHGPGHAYFIPTTTRWNPTPPPVPPPSVVDNATPSPEKNSMIASMYQVATGRVMRLAKGQPVFRDANGGPVVTRMSREGNVGYVGHAGGEWSMVIVNTGQPYADGETRPTGLYVPTKAGPISDR
jgi:hypothetical protein